MPAVRPLEPSQPTSIGVYRLTGLLGEGGQAVVYLAESQSGKQVAVKWFKAVLDSDPALRKGILRELETAKRVARFCTAQVLDTGMMGDRPFLVSEYVPGPSLHSVVTGDGPLSGSALDRLAIGTATALVSLHDVGIIHCDFKPGNVLLGPDGWRVIDFGLSRMNTGTQTLTSTVTGTPCFMAPEQLAAEPLSPATDVFAWASTLAFAATGKPPFGDDTIVAVMNRIVHYPPDLAGVEEPLRSLLAECFAKDPSHRPVAQRILDRLVRRHPDGVEPPSTEPAPGRPTAGPVHDPIIGADGTDSGAHDGVAPADGAASRGGGPHSTCDSGAPAATPRRFTRFMVGGAIAAAVTTIWLLPSTYPVGESFGKAPATADSVIQGSAERGAAGTSSTSSPTAVPRRGAGASTLPAAPRTDSSQGTAIPRHPDAVPAPTAQRSSAPKPEPTPAKEPQRLELGRGNFGAYCRSLGWDKVRWRNQPQPGAYCVKTTGESMYLTAEQRDAGCQWRYGDPKARHYFKGRQNFCYTYA